MLFAADLVPFASHLRISWIMGFDLNPLLTIEEKKRILTRAASEDWVIVFEHDPEISAVRIAPENGHFTVRERVEL